MIWYHFDKPYKVSKVDVSIRNPKGWCNDNRKTCFNQSPEEFEVIGSTDCKKWTTVLKIDDAGFTELGQTK